MHLLVYNAKILTCGEDSLTEYNWMSVNESGIIEEVGRTPLPAKHVANIEESPEKGVDCKESIVLPGLWDAHCHAYALGHTALKVTNLAGTKSIPELQERLRVGVKERPLVAFLEGAQWDHEELGRLPSRQDLDEVSTQMPIICLRRCWHICVVNSKTLKQCKINKETSQGIAGIDIDPETGNPTGILRENALELLKPVMDFEDSDEEKLEMLDFALQHFASNGVTSIQSNDTKSIGNISNGWEMYQELLRRNQGKLPCRVFYTTQWEDVKEDSPDGTNVVSGDDKEIGYLYSDRCKIFMDGALGANTAALCEPYSDNPSNMGLINISDVDLKKALDTAYKYKYRVEVHAIGDLAVEKIVNFVCKAKTENILHQRPVVTHCQMMKDETMKKVAQHFPLDNSQDCLVANIQPQFTKSDLPIIQKKLGPSRAAYSYTWKRMQTCCMLAGGSDAPVEPASPLQGMAEAMENALHPAENLTFFEALRMYTANAAYAAGRGVENSLGKLEVGFQADFVLTHLKHPEDSLRTEDNGFNVQATWIKGEKVAVETTGIKGRKMENFPGKSGRPMWRCSCHV